MLSEDIAETTSKTTAMKHSNKQAEQYSTKPVSEEDLMNALIAAQTAQGDHDQF